MAFDDKPQDRIGQGSISSRIVSEVLKAASTKPVDAVGRRRALRLRLRFVIEDVVTQVDPTGAAVVVIVPVGLVRFQSCILADHALISPVHLTDWAIPKHRLGGSI